MSFSTAVVSSIKMLHQVSMIQLNVSIIRKLRSRFFSELFYKDVIFLFK